MQTLQSSEWNSASVMESSGIVRTGGKFSSIGKRFLAAQENLPSRYTKKSVVILSHVCLSPFIRSNTQTNEKIDRIYGLIKQSALRRQDRWRRTDSVRMA